jgi:hypothetical protein
LAGQGFAAWAGTLLRFVKCLGVAERDLATIARRDRHRLDEFYALLQIVARSHHPRWRIGVLIPAKAAELMASLGRFQPEHDPEKTPVFRKDHAPTKQLDHDPIQFDRILV